MSKAERRGNASFFGWEEEEEAERECEGHLGRRKTETPGLLPQWLLHARH